MVAGLHFDPLSMANGHRSGWDTETLTLDLTLDTSPGLLTQPPLSELVRDLDAPRPRPLFEVFREMVADDETMPTLRPVPKTRKAPKTMLRSAASLRRREIRETTRHTIDYSDVTERELPEHEPRSISERMIDLAGFIVVAIAIGPSDQQGAIAGALSELARAIGSAYELLMIYVL